jgi:tRNA-Thr(GGU) m(6)t(6)A37 methyltransferase TsaA
VIHSPFTDQKNTPIQSVFSSAEGRVEVFPTYDQGLEGLEGFSHIFLIYHFHQAEPGSLRETPFLDGERPRGIFSIRHYNRPNPIGISIVELEKVESNVLFVKGIDVLDGTPLIDIKPYVARFDHRGGARSGWVDKKHIGNIKGRDATPGRLQDGKKDN